MCIYITSYEETSKVHRELKHLALGEMNGN